MQRSGFRFYLIMQGIATINTFGSNFVWQGPETSKIVKFVKHFLLDDTRSELFPTLELKFFQLQNSGRKFFCLL